MISPHYSYKEIPTELLHYNSNWDLHPFLDQAEPVSQSSSTIAQVGLVRPPLVLADKGGNYEFLTGWRSFNYLQSCSNKKQTTLWCRILPKQTSLSSALAHLFLNYSCTRPVYPIELARFISVSKANLGSNYEMAALFESIGIKSNKTYLERIEKLMDLEPQMQRAMLEGTLSENIARELLRLTGSDRLAIFTIITDLALGAGKQRRLISLLRDLSGRNGVPCEILLAEPEITQILHHPEMNIPQKSQALLNCLQSRLTPSLNIASSSFDRWQEQLHLPENQSIEHSPSFEKDEITLSIRFRNREDLENSLSTIQLLTRAKV